MICNVCKGTEFVDMRGRPKVQCTGCGSVERTRVLKLMLDELDLVKPGMRVMHVAPERGVSKYISDLVGDGYEAYDLFPEGYKFAHVKRMDLVQECESIPSRAYDLIIHSHVMEHIPANVSAVLFHLHRALKPDGSHLVCIPILSGCYDESLSDLDVAERIRRFGQDDHVRRFGAKDLQLTLGMVFRLPDEYDLTRIAPPEILERFNIPRAVWKGYSSSSVFRFAKSDLKLREF